MSFSDNFPTISPSLLLDFANTEALDPRISFVRTTTATYYGTETAKAEENLLLQSEDFTTSWGNVNTADTANTEVAPDGTTTADTITASGAGSLAHTVFQTTTVPSGTNVFSVFAKAGTNNYIQLFLGTQTGTFANFDVTAGAGATGTSGGVVSTSITSVGNDWFRCVMIFTQSNANNVQIALVSSSSAVRAENWTAAGTETVFLWGAQLEQRSAVTAYTPTTTQPITNYIPVLETAAAGEARFDHNPTTFESLGLLVEEQRTNLYTDSFINQTGGTGMTYSNGFPALDPTQYFVLGQETTANSEHFFPDRSFIPTIGTTYSFSVFAKQGLGTRSLRIRIASGNVGSADFNLTTGSTTGITGVVSSATITPVGNGVYRCTAIWTATAASSTVVRFQTLNGATTVYTGDGYSGLYIWGAQLEAGAFPTSYIATTSASVTRNADAASMTGTNFSSWFRADEGTLYAEATAGGSSTSDESFIAISNGSTADAISLGWIGSSFNRWNAIIVTNSVTQTSGINQATNGTPRNTSRKVVAAYKTNDVIAAYGGVISVNDTSVILPIVDRFFIGASGVGTNRHMNGPIAKIAYYPSRLSDAQLQALTTV